MSQPVATPNSPETDNRWMKPVALIFLLCLVAWAYYDCRLQKFMGAEFRTDCGRNRFPLFSSNREPKEGNIGKWKTCRSDKPEVTAGKNFTCDVKQQPNGTWLQTNMVHDTITVVTCIAICE